MKRPATAVALLVALLAAALPASADVTLRMNVSMAAGAPVAMDMTTVTYLKGKMLRMDVKGMNQDMSILVNLESGEQLLVNHATREVSKFDPQASAASVPMTLGEVTLSFEPSGEKKEILGRTCNGYQLSVKVPMTFGGETATMIMTGPVWMATEGPGVAEFREFYKAALAANVFVPSPMGAQGPQTKGLLALQKSMAEQGIILDQEMEFGVEGTGQMAQAMGQMNMKMTMKATDLSVDPIPEATFTVPADYTRK